MSTDTISRLAAALADRYRIEGELGQGGMATVYLAEDVKHQRKVAIKVLHPALAATLGSDRFLAEIRVTANLQHPHILPLLDSGEAGGFYYYVMPYVSGETLRERLVRTGALPVHDAVKILSEVVDALAAAHAVGLVHRDIKPENVMLSGRHALVMDFGVAKAVSEATGRSKLTTAGVALGTPAYMAPEQAAADPHLDHRVDIYAVGALGYELLSGRPPFGGMTNQEILAAHVTQAPEPITARRPACPPALAAMIMKCLEKRAADRFQSAEELLAQLETLATPSGGMTPTTTRPVEGVLIPRSNKAIWVLGAVGLVAALTVAGSWMFSRRPPPLVVLRDRIRLTSTGLISNTAISPDGLELAYSVSDCPGGTCSYDVEVKNVGESATQRPLRGATYIDIIRWSADRRNLLVQGTIAGRYGFYLVPALGGAPRFISAGNADFSARGDSLLIVPAGQPDSVFWLRFSGLDGIAHDSIRVVGPGDWMRVTSVPDSPWILINLGHGPSTEFRAIDRRGVEGGRLTHRSPIRVRMSADALWAMVLQDQAHPLPLLARVTFDRRTGRFSERVDTVNAGQFTQFDVTGDGGKLVLEEGTSEYRAWAMDLADAFRGTFRENRQLLHATTPIEAWLSRDGGRVVLWREEASSVGGDQVTVRPFGSGTETSLAQSGVLFVNGAGSVDTDQVVLVSRTSAGFQLTLTDLRSGARGTPFTVPENVASATLPAGGWVWIPPGGRSINIQRHGETTPRSFPVPPYQLASAPSVTPNGSELAFIGYDPATWPLMRLSTMSLSDGTVTEWLAYLCVGSTARWLPDHSILLWVEEPAKIYTVYRVRGPGQKERLGTIPRRIELLSVSNDLRRAAIVTRDYHGDAWMSTVVRP